MGIRLFARPTRFAQSRRGSTVHTRVLGSYVEMQKNTEELGETGRKQMNAAVPRRCPPSLFASNHASPTALETSTRSLSTKMLAVTPMQLNTGDLQSRVYGHAQTPHRQPKPRTCRRCPDGAARADRHNFAILQTAAMS